MKRSKVLKKIVDALNNCGLDYLVVGPEDIAEEILDTLEEIGMQPPKIQQYVLPNGQSQLSYVEWVNKWEKE